MGPAVLDRENPIARVLNPGERLIWVGRPRRSAFLLPAARYLVLIAAGFGFFFERFVAYAVGSLSALAQIEFFIVGGLFLAPLLCLDRLDRGTTYAVTNLRLLIATGPDRKQIRELTFADLGSVRVHWRRTFGRVLVFARRGPVATTPAWSFLDSGKPDKGFTPWIVDHPESVQQLIKNANDRYWFSSGEDESAAG
jgi:hypothetical protein